MRHPLTELSLDDFLPSEHTASAKRPLSPTAVLLSPTKRRILTAEGLCSPEKKRHRTSSKQLDIASSPPSPARKLDFTAYSSPRKASAKQARDASPRPETPVSHPNAGPRLQPSPTIASRSSIDASQSGSREDTFDSTDDRTQPSLTRISREIPAFADRQSIHWPGFDVYPDTYITIPTSDLIEPSQVIHNADPEDAKENIRPRKRVGKRPAYDDANPSKPCKMGRTESRVQDSERPSITSMMIPSPIQTAIITPQEKQQKLQQMKVTMELEAEEEDVVDDQL